MPIDFLRHAPWGRYLRMTAGAPTSRVTLWVHPQGLCAASGSAGRDKEAWEKDLTMLPELPPFCGGVGTGGGSFLVRLKKRMNVGSRPSLVSLLDTTAALIRVMPVASLPSKSVDELHDTLTENYREVFPSLEETYRWELFGAGLQPLRSGRFPTDRVVIAGIPEQEASEMEAWALAQGFIIDAIIPAAIGAAGFLLSGLEQQGPGDACFVLGTAVNAHRLVIEKRNVQSWEVQAGGADQARNLMANVEDLFGEHPALREGLHWLWEFENPGVSAPLPVPAAHRVVDAVYQTLNWWSTT